MQGRPARLPRYTRRGIFAPLAKPENHPEFRLVSPHIDATTVSRMRHLWTLIAAVVIAPLGWVMLAYGQDRSIQAFVNEDASGAFSNGDFIRPALCLGAAGLLLGLLGTLRFSPAGAVLTGLLYTGGYLAMLASPDAVLDVLPGRISLAGREADLETPLRTGSAMVLGAALLLAVASASRWRRPAAAQEQEAADRRAPLPLAEDRPLGADGLGLTAAAPASGDVFGLPPAWDGGAEPADGSGWGSGVPVTPGRSNQRPDGAAYAAQRAGHWPERARDIGPESRRWPTVR